MDDAYLELLKKCLTASLYDESAWRVARPTTRPDKRKRPIRSAILRLLEKRALMLVKRKPFDGSARDGGDDWPCFGYTMVGHRRLENIQECIETVLEDDVPGDLIETGVWRGGATIFMRAVLQRHGVTDRTVWVADSFEGMPRPETSEDLSQGRYDLSQEQYLAVSIETVKNNFRRFDLLDDKVRFLKGWFSESLPAASIDKIALLRIDCDLYRSTTDVLAALYDKVSKGGFVIVDDYQSWPPCKAAVNEFLAGKAGTVDMQQIDAHGVFWRVV